MDVSSMPRKARVSEDSRGLCAVAKERIEAREVILRIEGRVVDRPTTYSVQIGERSHIEPWGGAGAEDTKIAVWPFLNHSCDPNAGVEGQELVALRSIARGEPITFDYNTTEADIATPFVCSCGACPGRMIRGYRHLSPEEREAVASRVAAYLRR